MIAKKLSRFEFSLPLGAADLCHGLDPTNRSYDQAKIREHYISCLESRTITPFPKPTKRVLYHMDTKKMFQFSVTVAFQMTKKSTPVLPML